MSHWHLHCFHQTFEREALKWLTRPPGSRRDVFSSRRSGTAFDEGGATALAFCRGEDVFFFDFWHTARLTNFQTSSLLFRKNPFKRICPIGQQHDALTSKALKKGKFLFQKNYPWCLRIGDYNQFDIYSYSLGIPFVHNNYVYNTGDVI